MSQQITHRQSTITERREIFPKTSKFFDGLDYCIERTAKSVGKAKYLLMVLTGFAAGLFIVICEMIGYAKYILKGH